MPTIKEILAIMKKRFNEGKGTYVDKALWGLLSLHEKELPPFDDYFHKAFRQIDVIDGYTDSAIWNLLSSDECKMFWAIVEELTPED
jgi:hypothetical protein